MVRVAKTHSRCKSSFIAAYKVPRNHKMLDYLNTSDLTGTDLDLKTIDLSKIRTN